MADFRMRSHYELQAKYSKTNAQINPALIINPPSQGDIGLFYIIDGLFWRITKTFEGHPFWQIAIHNLVDLVAVCQIN